MSSPARLADWRDASTPLSFKLLGKGDHFQQFINNKASKSEKVFTEIEIKGFPGQGNYVIKRFYAHDSNSTTFKLNGA